MFREMVWHHHKRLGAKPQPFHLHGGGHHFKGFARAYLVSQQGIPAVHNMGDGIDLVGPQRNCRVHALETDMLAVVFTGTAGIEGFVVDGAQPFPAVDVFPNPLGKPLLDKLLPVLGDSGFFFVEHRLFIAMFVLDIIKNPHILLVQGLLQDVVGAHALGAVGGVSLDIGPVKVFLGDIPLAGGLGAQDFDTILGLPIGSEQLHHKLLIYVDRNPIRANTHTDLPSAQVVRLDSLQSLHLFTGGCLLAGRGRRQKGFCHPQLAAYIPRKVFVRRHGGKGLQAEGSSPQPVRVFRAFDVAENHAGKLGLQFLRGFAGKLGHILHVYTGFLCNRNSQGLAGGVHAGHSHMGPDGAFGEHIRFSF